MQGMFMLKFMSWATYYINFFIQVKKLRVYKHFKEISPGKDDFIWVYNSSEVGYTSLFKIMSGGRS